MNTAAVSSQEVQGDVLLQRPARALIGWMPPEEGAQWLAGPGRPIANEHRDAALRARAFAAGRAAGLDQTSIIQEAPASLMEHREALRQNPASRRLFDEGFEVAVADLPRICATQRHVLTDDAANRVADVDGADLVAIAGVSLPIAQPRTMPVAFDQQRQSWILSSDNPNLRILGQFTGPVAPGVNGFGFVVAVSTSFMNVGRYRGRYFLRDGYHRAYGFLARGIRRVPIILREYNTFEEMGLAPGLPPHDSYLGERPPVLADYFDADVSATSVLPVTQKVVIIQGLEVATFG